MLIQGENALILIPNDYGFSLVVGFVAQELAHGWIVSPCREILEIPSAECIADLVNDENGIRSKCRFGKPLKRGINAPFGCFSLSWEGDLP